MTDRTEAEVTGALDTVMALLAARSPDATICPSEVARALAGGSGAAEWRDAMPVVHAAVDRLAAAGEVWLSWKGEVLASRTGPYRVHRKTRDGGAT